MRLFLIITVMTMTVFTSVSQAQEFDANATYSEFCAACHGFDGSGMSVEIPDFTDDQNRLRKDENILTKIIMEGVEEADGTVLMPAFGGADPFSTEQSRELIKYLRENFGS
ncbi:c-type cytochrome [Terasakiella pusilla]|uniref:c-type cytochrome n=1 Tax=Terasakiella pusilla TaxID=64973 RepID=UPI00048A859A|nr:cytochrome c [Terasakiella pusilla]